MVWLHVVAICSETTTVLSDQIYNIAFGSNIKFGNDNTCASSSSISNNHPIKVMFNRTCLTFLCVYYIPGNCPTFFCLVSKYYNRARRTSFPLYIIISEINWLAYAHLLKLSRIIKKAKSITSKFFFLSFFSLYFFR